MRTVRAGVGCGGLRAGAADDYVVEIGFAAKRRPYFSLTNSPACVRARVQAPRFLTPLPFLARHLPLCLRLPPPPVSRTPFPPLLLSALRADFVCLGVRLGPGAHAHARGRGGGCRLPLAAVCDDYRCGPGPAPHALGLRVPLPCECGPMRPLMSKSTGLGFGSTYACLFLNTGEGWGRPGVWAGRVGGRSYEPARRTRGLQGHAGRQR